VQLTAAYRAPLLGVAANAIIVPVVCGRSDVGADVCKESARRGRRPSQHRELLVGTDARRQCNSRHAARLERWGAGVSPASTRALAQTTIAKTGPGMCFSRQVLAVSRPVSTPRSLRGTNTEGYVPPVANGVALERSLFEPPIREPE